MWTVVAHNIIKFRQFYFILLALITAFFAYKMKDAEWAYDFTKIVPDNDPDMVIFNEFKELFGEDGNIVALGVKDSAVFELENFRRYKYLSDEMEKLKGVNSVISLTNIVLLNKNIEEGRFEPVPMFETIPETQEELDSLLQVAFNQRYYSQQVYNPEKNALILIASLDIEIVNSENRVNLTRDIQMIGEKYTEFTDIEVHYGGLPFVRTLMATKVKKEMLTFLFLSIGVTGLILLLFFRSWDAVVLPMLIIGIVVVWVIGCLGIFGYKITILTGLIPPIIVVIGIPNSVYLINKYHQEFEKHGNKAMALSRVTRKIGMVTLITNITTAVGFLVLGFTNIPPLKEFGLIAGLNILATFVVSIILIPGLFSLLPPPGKKQLKHLQFRGMEWVLSSLDLLVSKNRPLIYFTTIAGIIICSLASLNVRSLSYVVDDLPKNSVIQRDMDFFEENFGGMMPLEFVVDSKKPGGVLTLPFLYKVDEFEAFLDDQPYLSTPVSVVDLVKGAKQAFFNNNPAYFRLPNAQDRLFIMRYLEKETENEAARFFVDSTRQKIRISVKMEDMGSIKMDSVVSNILQPKADSVFAGTGYDITMTGTTPVFVKGNKFLVDNLKKSLLLACLIIAIIMGFLFQNFRMIIISIIPNLIPLLFTAGLMGVLNIPLKPSTALTFSIAFGISVDDSLHFLAKYRQELFANKFHVPTAITNSIRETGASMIYTSIILFAGFIIFLFSEFGGTQFLGLLTSLTLIFAMLSNLVLLPALLLTFDSGKRDPNAHPLIQDFDEPEIFGHGSQEGETFNGKSVYYKKEGKNT